jgi:hypothetical protein
MEVWARIREHLSVAHLQAADFFCQESGRIEREYNEDCDSELLSRYDYRIVQHRSFVIGSVFSAVAFLEALINEFFEDASCDEFYIRESLDSNVVSRISGLWSLGIPRTARYSILQKYEIAVKLSGAIALEHGDAIYQEVKILTRLRNALMHFEPETVEVRASDGFHAPHSFDKFLKGKFGKNPLLQWEIPRYPDLYLSHDCASWAVKSAVSFVDDFFARIGHAPPYEYKEVEEVRVKWR